MYIYRVAKKCSNKNEIQSAFAILKQKPLLQTFPYKNTIPTLRRFQTE